MALDTHEINVLILESTEIRRAWGLIGRLAKELQSAKDTIAQLSLRPKPGKDAKAQGPKPEGYNLRIQQLEQKNIARKAALRNLNSVIRPFERETERLLVDALKEIMVQPKIPNNIFRIVNQTLATYAVRMGPRPAVEQDIENVTE